MEQVNDLKLIKKYYGENMMHLCRSLFPTILETPGLLFSLLEEKFAYSKFLYDDIVNNTLVNDFKNFIYGLIDVEKEEVIVEENPFELLKKAGYNLFKCETEEQIQEFKRYYQPKERICTFNGNRLSTCHVFFAIKDNVDEIKRENFLEPKRQDAYGTSVISIQFTKGEVNTLSIKNRYNHVVDQPDATFSNNLENIIPGLTYSFTKHYNLNINQNDSGDLELPGYVLANDGKFYKYNYEINNIYYCPDNIIIDNFEVNKDYVEKERYIITDYFIIDLVDKKVKFYDEKLEDSFIDGLHDIDKIEIIRDKQTGNRTLNITPKEGCNIVIELNKLNQIIGYKNDNIKEIDDNFLVRNTTLKYIELSNVTKIESDFLVGNKVLESVSFPKLVNVGDRFLYSAKLLHSMDLPFLERVGDGFMPNATELIEINVPLLKVAGSNFLFYNRLLKNAYFASLEKVGDTFCFYNSFATNINMPKLIEAGNGFFMYNQACTNLFLPCVEFLGNDCLYYNNTIKSFSAEKLKAVGESFMFSNSALESIYTPNLRTPGPGFLGGRYIVPKGK